MTDDTDKERQARMRRVQPLIDCLDFVLRGGDGWEWYAGLLPGTWERTEEREALGGEG